MSDQKTLPTGASVDDYIAQVEPVGRREDARELLQIFQTATGFQPKMWGPSMIGFGRYDYTYDSGHSGSSLATGFAPRKANMVVYILPGYTNFGDILGRLGKHKMGKSCLYLGRLKGVDLAVLEELIQAGLADLSKRWDIHPE